MAGGKVFVFGTGRSGTHTVYELFASCPGAFSLHEGANPPAKTLRLGDLMGLNVYLYQSARRRQAMEESSIPSGETLDLMRAAFASRDAAIERCAADGLCYCDVNRLAYNYINFIFTRYPDARFIHVVRDGYDCVRSWYDRQGAYPTPAMRLRHVLKLARAGHEGIPEWLCDLRLRFLLSKGHLGPAGVRILAGMQGRNMHLEKPVPASDDPASGRWRRMDRLEKLAWFWAHTNAVIEQRMQVIPADRKLTLRIEDLERTSGELLDFCGLRAGADNHAAPTQRRKATYSLEWTPANLEKFNALAAGMLNKHGYPIRQPGSKREPPAP